LDLSAVDWWEDTVLHHRGWLVGLVASPFVRDPAEALSSVSLASTPPLTTPINHSIASAHHHTSQSTDMNNLSEEDLAVMARNKAIRNQVRGELCVGVVMLVFVGSILYCLSGTIQQE
jgi:hypothetical protein